MTGVVQYINEGTQDITVSDSARKQLLSYLVKESQYKGARVSVKPTGCSGLSYVVDYVREIHADDVVVFLNDQYNLYVSKASYPYLQGMHMDYVSKGLKSNFVFDNPNQTGQCGCGESFTVKALPNL